MFGVDVILVLPDRLDFHRLRAFRVKTDIDYSAIPTVESKTVLLSFVTLRPRPEPFQRYLSILYQPGDYLSLSAHKFFPSIKASDRFR